jgi:tetratricopeptide (TPR) repeat protein
MKSLLRIIFLLMLLAVIIGGGLYLYKIYGPRGFNKRILDKRVSSDKRIELIKKNLNKIIELHKKHVATLTSLNSALKELGKAYLERIKTIEVLSDVQKRAAAEYLKAGYISQALSYYNKAKEINPSDVEAIVNIGICRYNLGLYENDTSKAFKEFSLAEEEYKKAYNISQTSTKANDKQWGKKSLLYLSLMYRVIKEKNYDKAEEARGKDYTQLALDAANTLYGIDPSDVEALFMLGSLYVIKNEPSKAKKYYSLIINADRSNPTQRKKAQKYIDRLESRVSGQR